MGGFVRFFRSVLAQKKSPFQPAQVITTTASTGATSGKTSRVRGQGSGVTGTIMTDATGIEEEANVSKTALGGTTTKKKKYKV